VAEKGENMEWSNAPDYLCSVCRKKVTFDKIKYGSDGKKLICSDCYKDDTSNKKTHKIIIHEDLKNSGNSTKYSCGSCGYKFSLKTGSRIHQSCPYCGNENIIASRNVTAADIVRDVKEIRR
jgi:DNA-directed RNA polymerase subunit RPC12/RpoP